MSKRKPTPEQAAWLRAEVARPDDPTKGEPSTVWSVTYPRFAPAEPAVDLGWSFPVGD